MNNDFEKVLREMAEKSKVKEPEALREKIRLTCEGIEEKPVKSRKFLKAAAVFIGTFIIIGAYLPTSADDSPIVRKVIEYLSGKHSIVNNAYIENGEDKNIVLNADGYEIAIEGLYYDKRELSIFYKLKSDTPFDKSREYILDMTFTDKNGLIVPLRPITVEYMDDNTIMAMASTTIAEENFKNLPEVLVGELFVNQISIVKQNLNNWEVNKIEVIADPIEIAVENKSDELVLKELNDILELDGAKARYVRSILSSTGLNLEVSRWGGDIFADYIIEEYVWDSKKGALDELLGTGYYDSNGELVLVRRFEAPSIDGEVSLVPYIYTSGPYGNGDTGRASIKKVEFKENEILDLGQYGTMEVENIVYKDNETIMTIRTKGLMSFNTFKQMGLYDSDKTIYIPSTIMNREVYGFLDMKADYIFKAMDRSSKYFLEYLEPNRLEVIEDKIVKLN